MKNLKGLYSILIFLVLVTAAVSSHALRFPPEINTIQPVISAPDTALSDTFNAFWVLGMGMIGLSVVTRRGVL